MLTALLVSTHSTNRDDRWNKKSDSIPARDVWQSVRYLAGEQNITRLTGAREDINWKGPVALQSNCLQSPWNRWTYPPLKTTWHLMWSLWRGWSDHPWCQWKGVHKGHLSPSTTFAYGRQRLSYWNTYRKKLLDGPTHATQAKSKSTSQTLNSSCVRCKWMSHSKLTSHNLTEEGKRKMELSNFEKYGFDWKLLSI